MKKTYLLFAVFAFIFFGCQDSVEEIVTIQEVAEIDMSDFSVYTVESDIASKSAIDSKEDKCYSMKVLNRQLKENPELENRMFDIEKHTRKYIAAKGKPGSGGGNGGDPVDNTDVDVIPINDNLNIIIPVYVHVIYSNTDENISDEQIASQITVLNNDFNNTNTESLPSGTNFQNDRTNVEISFQLENTIRYSNKKKSWGTNDMVKANYPPITPDTHLNIWVCNIGRGILGYAQFPGGNLATDGIVIGPQYFGSSDLVASGYFSDPYDKGRTATHEIGHWLNLRHIWGDGACEASDYVEDTPSSDRANYGCPVYPTVHCTTPDMTMNYMDYTYDDCMYMFTDGQKNRMRAIFASGGNRESFVQ